MDDGGVASSTFCPLLSASQLHPCSAAEAMSLKLTLLVPLPPPKQLQFNIYLFPPSSVQWCGRFLKFLPSSHLFIHPSISFVCLLNPRGCFFIDHSFSAIHRRLACSCKSSWVALCHTVCGHGSKSVVFLISRWMCCVLAN